MKEGTVPVPQTAPALNAIITYHVSGVIAFGESHSGGGGTPVSVYLVIELFSRTHIFTIHLILPLSRIRQ
jgi:hypothetical protein